MEKEMDGHEAKAKGNSRNPGVGVKEEEVKDQCVTDGIDESRNDENQKEERICRICHFGNEKGSPGSSELILLGCECKGELGFSHRHCAEAWFGQRENRSCEICGKTANNVGANSEDTSIFMMDWNEMRLVATTLDASQESSRRCKKYLCNFLLACLVLAFVMPWLFEVNAL